MVEQLLHQRAENHGIGNVGHEEFIETDHPRLVGELASDELQRILLALELTQLLVHPLHEAVEVRTHLALDRQRVEEGIHQVGLAPADATPEVQPLDREAALGPEFAEQTDATRRARCENLVIEPLQMPDRIFLRGIMEEVRTLEVRLIAFKRRHAGVQ